MSSAPKTRGAFGRGLSKVLVRRPFKRALRAKRFSRTPAARIPTGYRISKNRCVYVY